MIDEHEYDRTRAAQWADGTAAGRGFSRRDVLRTAALRATVAGLSAAGMRPAEAAEVGPAEAAEVGPAEAAPAPPPVPTGPIVKPLPPDLFTVLGTNAEMKWEAMRGVGYHTPVDRFFVRNHTSTPVLDRDIWRLRLFGTGLRHPSRAAPIEISFADLRRLPTETYSSFIECAGNGRSFYRLPGRGQRAADPPGDQERVRAAVPGDPAGRTSRLTGRSWSGHGRISSVRISTDGGETWHRPRIRPGGEAGWTRWELPRRPPGPGSYELLARATDETGYTQPDETRFNTLGHLFDAVVRHPVTVA